MHRAALEFCVGRWRRLVPSAVPAFRIFACGAALTGLLFEAAPLSAQQRGRAEARLERLRERSAQQRWDQLRSQWTPGMIPESNLGVWNRPAEQRPQTPAPAEPAAEATPEPAAHEQAPVTATTVARPASDVPVANASLGRSVEAEAATTPAAEDLARPFPFEAAPAAIEPVMPATPFQHAEIFSLFDANVPAAEPVAQEEGARSPLSIPSAEEYAPLAPADVALQPDGNSLDAALPSAPPQPIPFSQILPYYDYAPEGATLCPDPEGRCPEIVPLPDQQSYARCFPHLQYQWVASNIFYNPLYFEDPQLERYGHTHGMLAQPFVSLGRFGLQFVGLPYQKVIRPPHSCEYPLGWYRPGECAPKQVQNIPLNGEAAAVTAGFYTGLFAIFPAPF